MRIAILITAYNLPNQLDLLVRRLCQSFDVFLHLDKRFSYQTRHPRLFLTDVRYASNWGSYEQILATIELLKAAHKKGAYDRYVLISGQDVPCQSNAEIKRFFSASPSTEFIDGWPASEDTWNGNGIDRIRLFWFIYEKNLSKRSVFDVLPRLKRRTTRILERAIHAFQRTFRMYRNIELPMYVGSNWMDLTGNCVRYILGYLEDNPRYLPSFKHTRCAIEMFFHTVVLNSDYGQRRASKRSRYFDFRPGPELQRVLRSADEESILSSGMLFARKFDERIDSAIIQRLYSRTENAPASEQ